MLACLSWIPEVPAGCPSVKQTEAAVEDMLGRKAFAALCDVKVSGAMHRLDDGAWEANLSFVGQGGQFLGERNLQSRDSSCSALQGPVSLVIALMLESTETRTTFHVPVVDVGRPPPENAGSMGTALVFSSGLTPHLGLGATVGTSAGLLTWLQARFDATFWFPDATEASLGGQFWAWHAGASLCPTLLASRIMEGAVCAGAQAGVIHGTGVGFPYTDSPTKPYGDVDGRAIVSFPLFGPLRVFTQFGLAVPWLRPRFVYLDEYGASFEVHRPQPIVVFGGLGLELHVGGGNNTGLQ